MWRSRTQTTTARRSALATRLRTRSPTWTTTATTTTATPTTTWTTPATTRPSTTMGGERGVFEGLSKNSERGKWPQYMKSWLVTFNHWSIIQNQWHEEIKIHWKHVVFIGIWHWFTIEPLLKLSHGECVEKHPMSLSVPVANFTILPPLMSPWPECCGVTRQFIIWKLHHDRARSYDMWRKGGGGRERSSTGRILFSPEGALALLLHQQQSAIIYHLNIKDQWCNRI